MKRLSSAASTATKAAVVLAALALGAWLLLPRALEPVQRFERPDGRYSVVVLRRSSGWGLFPGQGGDAPGELRLLDADGRVLQQQSLPMVQLASDVQWQADRVVVPLVADWPTP